MGGLPLYEHRLTSLRLGERLFEVSSLFSNQSDRRAQPITPVPHEIAIGPVTQNSGAKITLAQSSGYLTVYESLDGKGLGTGMVINPAAILRMGQLPATDQTRKNEQTVVFTRPDASGKVTYRAGFAWAGDGEINTPEQWIKYLEQQAATPSEGILIDQVWSGHPVGFALLTERGHQFIAYYDAQRRLTLTGRRLGDAK